MALRGAALRPGPVFAGRVKTGVEPRESASHGATHGGLLFLLPERKVICLREHGRA